LGDQNQAEANQDTGANIAGSTLAGSSFAALFRFTSFITFYCKFYDEVFIV